MRWSKTIMDIAVSWRLVDTVLPPWWILLGTGSFKQFFFDFIQNSYGASSILFSISTWYWITNEIEMFTISNWLSTTVYFHCTCKYPISKFVLNLYKYFRLIEYLLYTSDSIRNLNNRTNITTKNNWYTWYAS